PPISLLFPYTTLFRSVYLGGDYRRCYAGFTQPGPRRQIALERRVSGIHEQQHCRAIRLEVRAHHGRELARVPAGVSVPRQIDATSEQHTSALPSLTNL